MRRIELVHLSHTEIGFTEHQSICRDLHVRYLDLAVAAIAATRGRPAEARFRWTAEATPSGHWLAVSRDSALVSFERPPVWDRRREPPRESGRLLAAIAETLVTEPVVVVEPDRPRDPATARWPGAAR